jgi:hypothetical protein
MAELLASKPIPRQLIKPTVPRMLRPKRRLALAECFVNFKMVSSVLRSRQTLEGSFEKWEGENPRIS